MPSTTAFTYWLFALLCLIWLWLWLGFALFACWPLWLTEVNVTHSGKVSLGNAYGDLGNVAHQKELLEKALSIQAGLLYFFTALHD